MRVLFTCGGTAGHINPAIGVAGRICELFPDAEILFVGAEGHMETELVPHEGYRLETVRIEGFQRSLKPRMIVRNLHTVSILAASVRRARRILKEFQPDVAVGTGGYVCFPVLKAAADMGIPTAVHESNAVPGLTTRMLEKKVDRILIGLEESRSFYKQPYKVELTGTPVRVDFRSETKQNARRELGLPEDEPIVLAAFGSLGAGEMNRRMEEMIRVMANGGKPFRLIYATGKRYYDEVRERLSDVQCAGLDLREYIYDMPKVMAAADVVLCRAGASTISELTYLGKPAVIIPSPNVVNHHQEKNAGVLHEAGAAKMLLEGQFDGQKLYDTICDMVSDPAAMDKMHEASLKMGVQDATDRICSIIMDLANSRN